jgi:hypothetical protein
MPDIIKVEVLEDGSLKIETDAVSMPNHAGAESLLREMSKEMGGKADRTRKVKVGQTIHEHSHDGHTHSH